jgi:anti-sigma regulatory factor (Ser/Thr protein kinase)
MKPPDRGNGLAMASGPGFRHEAVFYEGRHGFEERVLPILADAVSRGAIVNVMADPTLTAAIRGRVPPGPGSLQFEDAGSLGTNPARLMPRWSDFVSRFDGGRPLMGVGAIRYERTPAERSESELHEALLNVAFAVGTVWRLLCPYDVSADRDAVAEARRTHPWVIDGDRREPSSTYLGVGAAATTMSEPLPKAPSGAAQLAFGQPELSDLRDFLRGHLRDSGLSPHRIEDLLLASHEAATNCIRHGNGAGRISLWREDSRVLCEVSGNGLVTDPLVGRQTPDPRLGSGLGLWIVNQVCDLVQLRSGPEGTVVRMHMNLVA